MVVRAIPRRRRGHARKSFGLPLSLSIVLSFVLGVICSAYACWVAFRDRDPIIVQVPASSPPAASSVRKGGAARSETALDDINLPNAAGSYLVSPKEGIALANSPPEQQKSFELFAMSTMTDKSQGNFNLPACLADRTKCSYPDFENPLCQVHGHFYHTIYDRWLGPYASSQEPMQFLEIGYFQGKGFQAYTEYMSRNPNAELHSMEIACLPEGSRDEGKWPWGNFAQKHDWYQKLRDADRLHCGDASSYDFLKGVWDNSMKRLDAPPLKVVIDDAAHLAEHMAMSLFFWFPRIEPGGVMVVEDIQPSGVANPFRTMIIPQVVKDMHWCGGTPTETNKEIKADSLCFPQIHKLLQGVHCELHICVFVRNVEPAYEPDKEGSITPPDAFNMEKVQKCLFGPHA
ncbi:hypothetical protein ACHAWF_001664 [Thalassiosira exigua]